MSEVNHCDMCGKDDARYVGSDHQGGPLSWCPNCGCLMGFGSFYPAISKAALDATTEES